MMSITGAMGFLKARIVASPAVQATGRPVLTDPTRVSSTPCVLIEVPQIEPEGTLCGDVTFRHTVLVIGQPGAWAELEPLSKLLFAVLEAFEEDGIGWTLAEPIAYVPLVQDGSADPCVSYRITLEEFS